MPRLSPIAAALGVEAPKTREKSLPRAPEKLLLSIDEVAAMLGIGRRLAYELRATPGFPKSISLAGRRIVRYRATDVRTFVERLTADAAPSSEPEHLRAGKKAAEGRARSAPGGTGGGTGSATNGRLRPGRRTAESSSVEPPIRFK